MRIINYNVDKDTALRCLSYEEFILSTIDYATHPEIYDAILLLDLEKATQHLEIQLIDPEEMENDPDFFNLPIRHFKKPRYENIANLIHTIPIYLCSDALAINDKDAIKECDGDEFGAYCHYIKPDDIINKSPYIMIYPDSIISSAERFESTYGKRVYKWLFTKALLHELGHAALDIRNCSKYYNAKDKLESNRYDLLRSIREESMANAIALRIINGFEGYKDHCEFKCFIKDYIKHNEDTVYVLGIALSEFTNEDIEKYMETKVKGISNKQIAKWKENIIDVADAWMDKEGIINTRYGSQKKDELERMLKAIIH